MIRKIIVALVVLTCLVVPSAFARPGDPYRPYLTLGGGVTMMADLTDEPHPILGEIDITSDGGFNGFIAAGRAYDDGRVEFSLGYSSVQLDEVENSLGVKTDLEGDIQVASFLGSIFWDFNTKGALSPYFGLGVGVCQIRIDDTIIGADNRDAALAYQVGLGLSFNLSESTKFDVGYKLLGVVHRAR